MKCSEKIVAGEKLSKWRAEIRQQGRRLVATNGCFDLLHAGHVSYLEAARNCGDVLIVGVNSDSAVRELKGPTRPINSEEDRALVIAALQSVDAVHIFRERDAVEFLRQLQPDIYVKGGDYTLETMNQDERRLVESVGGKVQLLPQVAGKSTTAILARMCETKPKETVSR